MKYILLCLSFTCITAFGQSKTSPLLDKLKNTEKLMGKGDAILTPYQFATPPKNSFKSIKEILSVMFKNKAVMKTLPQDHMPCFIVAMDKISTMPNAADLSMLEKTGDIGIYSEKPKSPSVLFKEDY